MCERICGDEHGDGRRGAEDTGGRAAPARDVLAGLQDAGPRGARIWHGPPDPAAVGANGDRGVRVRLGVRIHPVPPRIRHGLGDPEADGQRLHPGRPRRRQPDRRLRDELLRREALIQHAAARGDRHGGPAVRRQGASRIGWSWGCSGSRS